MKALEAICQKSKAKFFESVMIRKLIGSGGELFMFHQEWSSTEKAVSLAANYVTFCLRSHQPNAFNSASADVQTALQRLREALTPTSEVAAVVDPLLNFLVEEMKSLVQVTGRCYDVGTVRFILFSSLDTNKVLRKPNSVTKYFSYMEYVFKVAVALSAGSQR